METEASRAARNLISGVHNAGARAFVGGMWHVDDEAAATIVAGLYKELIRAGEPGHGSVGSGVRRGPEHVIATHGESEPAWAAYALPLRQPLAVGVVGHASASTSGDQQAVRHLC